MSDTSNRPMGKAQRSKANAFRGGAKVGIALALDELKKELPAKYHPLLSRKKKELCNLPDFGYAPPPDKFSRNNKQMEPKEDCRHPMDFDPDAHRSRYNYDEDWNSDDY